MTINGFGTLQASDKAGYSQNGQRDGWTGE